MRIISKSINLRNIINVTHKFNSLTVFTVIVPGVLPRRCLPSRSLQLENTQHLAYQTVQTVFVTFTSIVRFGNVPAGLVRPGFDVDVHL